MDALTIKIIPCFILFFAVLMICNQLLFKPIHCFYKSTASVTAVHRDFVELNCYYHQQFYINDDDYNDTYFTSTKTIKNKGNTWFTLILFFQVATFLIPKLLSDKFIQYNNLLLKCKNENYLIIAKYIHRLRNYKTVYHYIFIKFLIIGICIFHIYYIFVYLFLSDTEYVMCALKGIFLVKQEKQYNFIFNPIVQCKLNMNDYKMDITSNCIIHGNILFEKIFIIILLLCLFSVLLNLADILELKMILNEKKFFQRYKSILNKELNRGNFDKYINYNIRFLLFVVEKKVGLYLSAQVIVCLNNLFDNFCAIKTE